MTTIVTRSDEPLGFALDRRTSVTIPSPPSPSPDLPGEGEGRGGGEVSLDDWLPLRTYNGIKWVPTIPYQRHRTCPTCPVYAECSADVARGDFAWCEDIIPADYTLTNQSNSADSIR